MPAAESDFTRRLDALDVSLFDAVATQSSDDDRRAWLAVQRAVRSPSGYVYLEIGSHLGGSIQQHLLDPWCRAIVSIDKRPLSQPDDRGIEFRYDGNSTACMLEHLRRVAPDALAKLRCFDADASEVEPSAIGDRADFCLIDGAHVHAAVLADFEACLRFSSPNAAICFHDAFVTHRAIATIVASLRARAIPWQARKLGGSTFGIFLGDCPARTDARVQALSRDGEGWLFTRRMRDRIPAALRPAARWLFHRLKISS
jgi:hypothetical protein